MAMNEKPTASKSNGGTPSASDRIQSQPRAKEMQSRVTASGSYSEALDILDEYVEICSPEIYCQVMNMM